MNKYGEISLPINANDEDSLFFLCLIAYYGSSLTDDKLRFVCNKRGIKLTRFREIVNDLYDKGLTTQRSYYWNYVYGTVKPYYYFTVAFLLLDRHPDWVNFFENLSVRQPESERFRFAMAKALHTGDENLLSHIRLFPNWGSDIVSYFDTYFYQPFFLPAFSSLTPTQFEFVLLVHLDRLLIFETWNKDYSESLLGIIDYYGRFYPNSKAYFLDIVSCYRFMFDGTQPLWQSKDNTQWSLCIEAIRSLYRGELEQAGALFESSLKLRNKTAEVKNMYQNELLCFYLVLYYAKANTPATVKKANQLLNKTTFKNYVEFAPCFLIVKYIINGENDNDLFQWLRNYFTSLGNQPVAIGFTTLLAHYFGKADLLVKSKYITNQPPKIALLRYELSPYLETSDRQELEKLFGGEPVLASIHKKEYWESVIESLTADLTERTAKPADQPSTRLIYVISDYESMELYGQRILKSGAWSVGTRASIEKFMRKELEGMDETDKRVAGASRSYSYYSIYARYAIPQLVGSDRVFYNAPRGRQPVEIAEEKPFIAIEKSKNGFVVKTNVPQRSEYSDPSDGFVIRRDDKTHFTVFRLNDFERKTINTLTALGQFPKQAEPSLIQFLKQISGKIEIHSDLLEGGSSLEKKDGLSRLVLRIVPNKEDFTMSVLAQPLEGGKIRLMAGVGDAVVFDEAEGVRYQVSRDLEAEKDNLKEIKGFVQDQLHTTLGAYQADLSPDELLTLLEFVSDRTDRFEMEWPEGKQLNLKAKLTQNAFNMQLTSKENWFEVEGNVQIGNDLMSAIDFLNLISQGIYNERYIKLNETDYIALSENLAKYLRRLEGLTQVNHGKSRIPFYQVGDLAEIVNGTEGGIRNDKGMDTLMKKIKKAAKMKIEVPSQLKAQLRDYQREGFEWMVRLDAWGAGACLADDMGLGKTVQTIAFMLYKAEIGPSLVVCPASVMLNWANELSRFSPALSVKILNESADREQLLSQTGPYDVVLTTYGLLVREEKALTATEWNIICLDEAHTIKNRGTKMSSSAMKLKSKSRVILTGTPVQNYLSELWNLFQFLNPGLLGTFDSFMKKYIIPIEQDGDKERQRQLKRMITPFLLRRTKVEVIEELPEKTDITLRIALDAKETAAYETMREAAEKALESEDKVDVNTLAQITRLRQAACAISLVEKNWNFDASKVTAAVDLLNNIVEAGNSVLVFSQFTSFLTMVKCDIEKRIGKDKLFYLDGSTTIRKREKMVADFQHGVAPVFLISLKAGGLGLNLTNANYVIHLDPWWNPAIEQQATDRAYRIGQNKNVTVYHLIAENTIEEKILRLHQTKRDLADSLLNDSNVSRAMTIEDLRFLCGEG